MPKMKTHSGAAKRVQGDRQRQAPAPPDNMNHILEKKPSKRTRRLNREETFAPGDEARIKRLLGRR